MNVKPANLNFKREKEVLITAREIQRNNSSIT